MFLLFRIFFKFSINEYAYFNQIKITSYHSSKTLKFVSYTRNGKLYNGNSPSIVKIQESENQIFINVLLQCTLFI